MGILMMVMAATTRVLMAVLWPWYHSQPVLEPWPDWQAQPLDLLDTLFRGAEIMHKMHSYLSMEEASLLCMVCLCEGCMSTTLDIVLVKCLVMAAGEWLFFQLGWKRMKVSTHLL